MNTRQIVGALRAIADEHGPDTWAVVHSPGSPIGIGATEGPVRYLLIVDWADESMTGVERVERVERPSV